MMGTARATASAGARAAVLAALCGLLPVSAAPSAGAAEAGGEGTEKVSFGKDLLAEFDANARLTVRRGKVVLVRGGGLLVAGKDGRADQSKLTARKLPGAGGPAAWSLVGEEVPGNPRATLRAIKNGDILALAWDLSFRELGAVSGWGYFLELPAAGHADAELRLGGRTVALPRAARAKAKAEIFRGRARAVELVRGKQVYLRLLRDIPTTVVVRDLRAEGGTGFGLLFAGRAADLAGRARGRFCLAVSGGPGPVRPLVYHAELWPPAAPGRPLRAEIGLLADYRSPFDPAEVRIDALVSPPGGPTYRQPAFYAQEYSAKLVKIKPPKEAPGKKPGTQPAAPQVREVLVPTGEPGWRALVEPGKVGPYGLTVEVKTPAGTTRARARPLRMVRAPGERLGPLRPSRKDRRYLVDPGGKPVFLLGHNLGWLVDEHGPLGTAHWRRALARMQAAGLNYARVWLSTWSLGLETSTPYKYSTASAWRLERIIQEAARRGIHVQLCLDNFDDFRKKREKSPYFAGTSPVCRSTRDFFTSRAARRMYGAKLRYLVARYGHHQNLLAWELWNELDYCIDKINKPEELQAAREEYLVPWVRRVARELGTLDRRRRIVTCSLADGTIWPELTGAPEIGLAESHLYLYMPKVAGGPTESARSALEAAGKELLKYGKPGFVSEFGFGAEGGPRSPINEVDRLGVHLHNGLWLSALGGHAGAVTLWWWDSYLAPPSDPQSAQTEITGEDRYWHYRALAKYLKGVDWLAGWKKLTVSPPAARGPHPAVTGLRTDRALLVWVADPRNSWYNRAVKKYKPVRITEASFVVDGLVPGQYLVEWWDTYSGKVRTASRQGTDEKGSLRLRVPSFSRDVAARVTLVARRAAAGRGEGK